MPTIEFTNKLKDYELKYWMAHREEEYTRSLDMVNIFNNYLISGGVVADVGCGPYGGIFRELKFPIMFAIDPLWNEYDKYNLSNVDSKVVRIVNNAENFKLSKRADMIFSFNALDHSGNLERSFHNIMRNLKSSGKFYFHIHLRTIKQINAGHVRPILESEIDKILKPFAVELKRITETCPLDKKPYRSYIGIVRYNVEKL
jgi:SAM-dependent methyltransferase